MTLTATDAVGIALSSIPVTFTVTGEMPKLRLLTTDGSGQIGFAYAGAGVFYGPDTVQAAAYQRRGRVL